MDQPQSTRTPESLALRLLAMINRHWTTQALYVAAELGLPDLLANGPKTSASLAQATGAHAPSLHRLLRALVTLDIVQEREDGTFALLPMGALLRSDAATSLRAWALFTGQNLWQEWGHLLDSIKTGESASQRPTGTEGPRPAVFNQAMVELTRLLTSAVGHGELLVAILQAYPEACGVLFDMPHVVAQGRQHLARADLAHRCECVAGDFLESVPGGGDTYVLKSILHNWTDAQSTRILDNCRRAMPAGAKLLVVEGIMPERLGVSAADQAYARLDLLRLITVAAQERTAAEYRALLASAGFHLTRIIPVGGLSSLLEAIPV
jgi:hypothetical protein